MLISLTLNVPPLVALILTVQARAMNLEICVLMLTMTILLVNADITIVLLTLPVHQVLTV